jgi:hypothetical protein
MTFRVIRFFFQIWSAVKKWSELVCSPYDPNLCTSYSFGQLTRSTAEMTAGTAYMERVTANNEGATTYKKDTNHNLCEEKGSKQSRSGQGHIFK